jgi:hypothetical protein
MPDSFSEDALEPTSQKRLQRWLGSGPVGRRIILGLIFLFSLSLFLHFRQMRVEFLEVGSQAPRYIIGQVDFSFPDEEATQVLKQEAVRDIDSIYKIDEKQLRSFRSAVEYSIVHYQKWRQELPNTTFEEIYQGLDILEDDLIASRFTDKRTLQKMRSLQLRTEEVFPLRVPEGVSMMAIPAEFWVGIENDAAKALQDYFDTADSATDPHSIETTIAYLTRSFQSHAWQLQQDFSLEHFVRETVQAQVMEKYTHVEAGSRIIESGEKVTPRHIAMLQAMKKELNASRNLWAPLTVLGSVLLAFCLIAVCWVYLRIFQREQLLSFRKMTLLVAITLLTLALSKLTECFLLSQTSSLVEAARLPIFIPFATILTCILIGPEIAVCTSVFLLVVIGITLAVDHDLFLVLNFVAFLVALLSARALHKRKEIFSVCSKIWLSCIPVIFAFHLIGNSFWDVNLSVDLLSTFVFMVITAILVIGLLPLLESIFHVMTDMTLMEYMDPNNELLRRLSIEAPGTYQHCLVVGNLSEAGARAIGANGLFCRVSTLYHDIGKLFNPHYFTENQLGGFNIHQLLTPIESTHVIIAHIPEGEALARKYSLPQSFIDVIREHHGTTMVYYFYCKQVEHMGGDPSKVNEKLFRYPGPKPRSKESAIIMIADTVEAASRSMDEINEETMTDMVDKLVKEKLGDGQFNDCQLTFEELGKVKRAMVRALLVTRHLRIKYPERDVR